MQQLTQKLKNGAMQILEVPTPALTSGCVLVRNHYSLISAGTEGSTVKAARSSLLDKVRSRPQQVRQVIDTLKSQGITQTYRAVMKKLDAYSPLGYSSCGEVIGVAPDVVGFKVGDLVACGGLSACHAEVVCVPVNLCVPLPADADLQQAAYNTLGAIAMQGVRQADLRVGETCAVIGLGLLGQLSALILKASGVRVVGIDVDPAMVASAAKHCADLALVRRENGVEQRVTEFTGGLGCDAVIITAAADSLDPINFAGALCRKRATVVVVGAVPTGFDRDPHYYRKELQLRMSCSYGPGRYDPAYEEQGIDYPAAYVRWTENRNMRAFQELIHAGRIDVGYLTTHTFDLDEALSAYNMMMERSEPFVGILIRYRTETPLSSSRIPLHCPPAPGKAARVGIGFIGAGSYAQSHLLPNIPKRSDVVLKGVLTASGTSARSVGERFGFAFCAGDEQEIFGCEEINTVFIASRHDSHADYVLKALRQGRHVFVEKPLCLNEEQLAEISQTYGQLAFGGKAPHLMVGFNRRFAPLALMLKKELGGGPMAMTYRVNAGHIPKDSWIQDPVVGGGRVIGEVCHFVDFLTFLNGSPPVRVYAAPMKSSSETNDTLTLTLQYRNGSVGTVSYFANGDKGLAKEKLEVFANGCTCVLDDFRTLTIHARGRARVKGGRVQDKGQKSGVTAFIEGVLEGNGPAIPFEEIHSTTLVTLKALESLRTGESIVLTPRD
ncbi:MAG: bi-domain-containing oxidoreductase [Syntrophotaleaceae bacterium]